MPRALLMRKPRFKADSGSDLDKSLSDKAEEPKTSPLRKSLSSPKRLQELKRAKYVRNLVLRRLRRSRRYHQTKQIPIKVAEALRIRTQNSPLVTGSAEDYSEDDENCADEQPHYIKWMKKDGTTKKVWECGICHKEFIHQYTLMRHIPIHTGERNFKCDICDKAFRQASTLCRHKAIHSDARPFLCNVCDKAFNRSSTLIAHRKTHSELKKHICHVCGKGFHQKGNLKNHIYTHTGERPYKCDKCERGFNQISNLMCHKAHAHVEKPKIICQLCGKEFPRKFSLRCHEEYKHGIKYNGENRIIADQLQNKQPCDQVRRGRPSNCNTSKTVILPNGDKTIKFLDNHVRKRPRPASNRAKALGDANTNCNNLKDKNVQSQENIMPVSSIHSYAMPVGGSRTSVNAPSFPMLNKSTGILIDPITTPAMAAAQANGQTPFALLRPTKGVPVLVKILSTLDGKQVLVPASSDDLKVAGKMAGNPCAQGNETQSGAMQVSVPVVANISQRSAPNGLLVLEIDPMKEDEESQVQSAAGEMAPLNCEAETMEAIGDALSPISAAAIQLVNTTEMDHNGDIATATSLSVMDESIQGAIDNLTQLTNLATN